MELVFAALAIASGAVAIYTFIRRRYLIGCGAAYLCVIGVAWFLLEQNTEGYRLPAKPDELADSRPKEEAFDDYVSSDTCRSCHPGEYHSWHATYHRTMTQVASPDSVLAEIDGRVFKAGGHAFELEKRGDEVWTKIYPANRSPSEVGRIMERRFVMTTGSHNYQVYWLDGDYDRWSAGTTGTCRFSPTSTSSMKSSGFRATRLS